MSTELREELKAFEKDLATLVARFIRLYEKLEVTVRPESRPPGGPQPPTPTAAAPTTVPQSKQVLVLAGYQ